MSLSAILDEIQDGAVKPDDAVHTAAPGLVDDRALEHLSGLPVVVSNAKALGEFVYMNRVVRGALTRDTLDKTTALELFTMLPMGPDASTLLTASPSKHNKNLLTQVHKGLADRNDELMAMTREVRDLVGKSLEVCCENTRLCTEYLAQFELNLKRLSSPGPIVIMDGVGVNLLDADMHAVAYFNTSKLGYPPYENVLDLKFRGVVLSPVFEEIERAGGVRKTPEGSITLRCVVDHLIEVCSGTLTRTLSLQDRHEQLVSASLPDSQMPYDQYLIDETLAHLSALRRGRSLFATDDNLADKVLDCLSFLV